MMDFIHDFPCNMLCTFYCIDHKYTISDPFSAVFSLIAHPGNFCVIHVRSPLFIACIFRRSCMHIKVAGPLVINAAHDMQMNPRPLTDIFRCTTDHNPIFYDIFSSRNICQCHLMSRRDLFSD